MNPRLRHFGTALALLLAVGEALSAHAAPVAAPTHSQAVMRPGRGHKPVVKPVAVPSEAGTSIYAVSPGVSVQYAAADGSGSGGGSEYAASSGVSVEKLAANVSGGDGSSNLFAVSPGVSVEKLTASGSGGGGTAQFVASPGVSVEKLTATGGPTASSLFVVSPGVSVEKLTATGGPTASSLFVVSPGVSVQRVAVGGYTLTTTITGVPTEGQTVCDNMPEFTFAASSTDPSPSFVFVYRIDGGTWQGPIKTTSVTIGPLSDGPHTVEVAAIDELGNEDPNPAKRTFTVDTLPPVITALAAVPTITGASVTWTTDKPANSLVEYRVTGTTLWSKTPLSTALVTSHTVVVSGLAPAKTYDYQAVSADSCGQETVSASLVFTTLLDTPPTTTITNGPADGATVCGSDVTFTFSGGDAVTPVNALRYEYRLDGGVWSEPALATSVSYPGLADGIHTFEVAAINQFGTVDPHPVKHTFTIDTAPPVISAVAISGVTPTGATVTWTTDKPATSQVDYRSLGTTGWTSTGEDIALLTSHSVILSGLAVGTFYEFRVRSIDACDHAAVSPVQPLTTQNPVPTITSLSPTSALVGTTGLILTINGTGFLPTSTVAFGTFTGLVPVVGSQTDTQLQVVIPDSALTRAGPVGIIVTNPAPGGGTSNSATFTVAVPAPPAPVLQALVAGDAQVSLIFTTVLNATSYTLKSATQSGGPYTTDVTGITADAGAATITTIDPNQPNGLTKYYVVSAVGPGGESPNSNELSTAPRHINQPPTVILTSPADGTTLTAPASLTLTATASDLDGIIAQVEFFQNNVSVGVVTTAPYTLPVSGLAVGTYAYKAVATDNSGATATSATATVTVSPPPVGPALLTGPADQSTVCSGTAVFTWTGYSNATPAAQLRYQYQVDGGAWSVPAPDTTVTLSGLAEGLHTFTLRLLNADGTFAGSPVSVSFYVSLSPPTLLSSAVDARDTRAVINWTSSKPTTGQIEYGTTTAYGQNAPADTVSDGAHHTGLSGLTTQTTYHYRIHFTDGCHAVVSDDQTFTTQPLLLPNLEVIAATVPPSFAPLGTFNLSWAVLNAGPGDALINWTDSVYLSTKSTLDASATLVGSFDAASTLYSFTSYTQKQTVTIPRVPPGSYYLIIQTNSSNVLPETTTSDNALATPVEITALQDLVVTPDQPVVTLKTGVAAKGQFTLTDLSLNALTGITATVQGAPANITVQVTPPTSLLSLQSQAVTYTVTAAAADASVLTSAPTVVFISDSGAKATATLKLTIIPPTPQLVVAPLTLKTSMVRGGQRLVDFTVTNTGDATATALSLVLPAAPWLSLTTPVNPGDLAPGATATFELALTPAADLPLGIYSGTIGIKGANAGTSIPFGFNCISSATGGLKVVAQDEFSFFADTHPNVTGAHVVISDYTTGAVAVDDVTDANGVLTRSAVPEGDYNVDATAEGHAPFHSTLHLVGGETNEIDPFLSKQLVTYTWTVIPVPTSDQYVVTLNATFDTHVPAPVITVDPSVLDLTKVQFDSNGQAVVNYTITNHGLIAANNVAINIGSDSVYTLTPFVANVGTIPALNSVIVPVTITRAGVSTLPAAKASGKAKPAALKPNDSSSGNSCSLNGSATYNYNCGGIKTGSAPIVVETGEGNCTGLDIINSPGSPGASGGFSGPYGGPGGTINGPPGFVIPQLCPCSPDNPNGTPTKLLCVSFTRVLSPFFDIANEAIKKAAQGQFDANLSLKTAEGCVTQCCKPDGSSGYGGLADGQADFKAGATIFGREFKQKIEDIAIATVPVLGPLHADLNMDVLVGAKVSSNGSVKLGYQAGCDRAGCLTASGNISFDAKGGAQLTVKADLKDENNAVVGSVDVEGEATLNTGISGSLDYNSCGDGLNATLCFKGVYFLFIAKATFTLFDGGPSGTVELDNKYFNHPVYLVDPVGICAPANSTSAAIRAYAARSGSNALDPDSKRALEESLQEVERQIKGSIQEQIMLQQSGGGRR